MCRGFGISEASLTGRWELAGVTAGVALPQNTMRPRFELFSVGQLAELARTGQVSDLAYRSNCQGAP